MTPNPPAAQPSFLLLFRHTRWDRGLSTEETRAVLDEVNGWFEGLFQSGKALGGHPLLEHGKTVSGRSGQAVVTDGPFAESKEAVGGYLLLAARDFDEAVAIARSSPLLRFGVINEVRELAVRCPILSRIEAELATA